MKKITLKNRILSGILALVTLISLMPVHAWGTEPVTQEPVMALGEAPLQITREGENAQLIQLAAHERIEINAENAGENAVYQWQILHPEKETVWINIYDATHGYLFVTLALVRNMMTDDNIAHLRCRVTEEGQVRYSDPVTVQFRPEQEYIPAPAVTEPPEAVEETTVPAETEAATEPETTVPAETEAATEPETTAPAETEAVTEPETTAPAETEAVTEPETTAPVETEAATEPETTAPAETEAVIEPETTAPAETEAVTEPETTAPAETEAVTEPETTAPAETEAVTEPETTAPAETEAVTEPETTEPAEALALAAPESQPLMVETVGEEMMTQLETAAVPEAETAPEVVVEDTATVRAADPVNPEAAEFVSVTIEYIRYDFARIDGKLVTRANTPADWENPEYHGDYLLEQEGSVAFNPYVATLQYGTDLKDTKVPVPTMMGYDSYLNDEKVTEVDIALDNITQNVVYMVKYLPASVSYTVRYYFQNIYDDLYVEDTDLKEETTGFTGATPPDNLLKKEVPGFLPLYYQPDSIAADGSTVFDVYYERNYYLMEFDCNGGYGTETLYNRYGSYVSVPNPVRSGYNFVGWDKMVKTDEGKYVDGDGTADTLPETMPAENTAYKAIWTTDKTTYTVVYWAENANDTGYSYWGSKIIGLGANNQPDGSVTSNMLVSGTDHQTATGLANAKHFTYNAAKTQLEEAKRTDLKDGKAVVEGDGSTVINVYYSRNYYTIYFKGYGTCAITPHTHGTDCQYRYYCGQGNHVHDESCNATLICTIPEHETHVEGCRICGKDEHIHSNACCSITEHVHSTDCCSKTEHTHSTDCYTLSNGRWGDSPNNQWLNAINNPDDISDAGIVSATRNNDTRYYYKIGDTWYRVWGFFGNWKNITVTQNCTGEHTHGDGSCDTAKCGQIAHTHGDGTCNCTTPQHTHTDSCYKDEIHTHGETCYIYSCNEEAHTHTGDCYKCILPTHTHTDTCNRNNNSNTIYVITAKFEQNIGDIWPTYDVLKAGTHAYKDNSGNVENANGNRFRGWTIDGVSSEAVSKRVTMTDDLCDTSDGVKNATANYDYRYFVHLYYMFESFDQTSPENGNERKLYNGVYYDKSSVYYQDVYANSSTFGQKEITGMIEQGVQSSRVSGNEYNNFLYYTRDRVTFKFHNINTTVATIGNIMFGQPLKNLTVDGKPVSSYVPPYPTTYEPEAYEFGGWYTTPECFDGTEVNWENATMPNTEMEVYAKWTPIKRNVTFYTLYSDIGLTEDDEDYDADLMPFLSAPNVPHGEFLGSTYYVIPSDKKNPDGTLVDTRIEGYEFIGWFYIDEDNKKRFAPDTMEITRDLVLFAEWKTSIDTTYSVNYVLRDDVGTENTLDGKAYPAGTPIADVIFAHSSVGKTKTFNAKALGDLYPAFREKFFPTTNSHSILMQEDERENAYTFEYVFDDTVYYKVRYLEAGTNKVLHPEVHNWTDKAVVTEKFLPIAGYIPQNYYIRKTLAYDGTATEAIEENVITFYYVRDTEHGMYSIEYYLENETGGYTKYESIVGTADLNTQVSADIRTYEGYTYQEGKSEVYTYEDDGTEKEPAEGISGTVTANGLTIKLYYKRNSYPYIVEYREYGKPETDPALKTINVVTDKSQWLKFGTTYTYDLDDDVADFNSESNTFQIDNKTYEFVHGVTGKPTDEGYQEKVEAAKSKTITIRADEEGEENRIIFYFTQKQVEIFYHAVCTIPVIKENFGVVSPNMEKSDTIAGSTATPANGFKFVGWYKNAACTDQIDPQDKDWFGANDNGQIIPEKLIPKQKFEPDDKDTGLWENHYYALFEPVKKSLTITKQGVNAEGNSVELPETDSFLFRIQSVDADVTGRIVDLTVSISGSGSVTIPDLFCGEYTVTELASWSWAYANQGGDTQTVNLTTIPADGEDKAPDSYTVTFTNRLKTPAEYKWLHGENHKDNRFANVPET